MLQLEIPSRRRKKRKRQILRSRKSRRRPLEKFLDHICIEHDRDRENQTRPEFSEKHSGAVPGMLIMRTVITVTHKIYSIFHLNDRPETPPTFLIINST